MIQLRCYKEQRENKGDTAAVKFMDQGVGIGCGSGRRGGGAGESTGENVGQL